MRKVVFVIGAVAAFMTALTALAWADVTSTLDAAQSGFFTTLLDRIGGLVPLVMGLAVVGIVIGLIIRWGSKAAKKS